MSLPILTVRFSAISDQQIQGLPYRIGLPLQMIQRLGAKFQSILKAQRVLSPHERNLAQQFDNDAAWGATADPYTLDAWKRGRATLALTVNELLSLHFSLIPELMQALTQMQEAIALSSLSYSQRTLCERELSHWKTQIVALEKIIRDGLDVRQNCYTLAHDVPTHCDDLLWAITLHLNQATAAARALPTKLPRLGMSEEIRTAFKMSQISESAEQQKIKAKHALAAYRPLVIVAVLLWARGLIVNRFKDVFDNMVAIHHEESVLKKVGAFMKFVVSTVILGLMLYVMKFLPLSLMHYAGISALLVAVPFIAFQLSYAWKTWTGQFHRDALAFHPYWSTLDRAQCFAKLLAEAPQIPEFTHLPSLQTEYTRLIDALDSSIRSLDDMEPSWWMVRKGLTREALDVMRKRGVDARLKIQAGMKSACQRTLDTLSLASNVVNQNNIPILSLEQLQENRDVVETHLGLDAKKAYEKSSDFVSLFFIKWQAGDFTQPKVNYTHPWGRKILYPQALERSIKQIERLVPSGPRRDAFEEVMRWVRDGIIPTKAGFKDTVNKLGVPGVEALLQDLFFDFMETFDDARFLLLNESHKAQLGVWANDNQKYLLKVISTFSQGMKDAKPLPSLLMTWQGKEHSLPNHEEFVTLCQPYEWQDKHLGTTVGKALNEFFKEIVSVIESPKPKGNNTWIFGYLQFFSAEQRDTLEVKHYLSRLAWAIESKIKLEHEYPDLETLFTTEERDRFRALVLREPLKMATHLQVYFDAVSFSHLVYQRIQVLRTYGMVPLIFVQFYAYKQFNEIFLKNESLDVIKSALATTNLLTLVDKLGPYSRQLEARLKELGHAGWVPVGDINQELKVRGLVISTASLFKTKASLWYELVETALLNSQRNPEFATEAYFEFIKSRNSLGTDEEKSLYQLFSERIYSLDRVDLHAMMSANPRFIETVFRDPALLETAKHGRDIVTPSQESLAGISGVMQWLIVDVVVKTNTLTEDQTLALYQAASIVDLSTSIHKMQPLLSHVNMDVKELSKLVPIDTGDFVYRKNALAEAFIQNRDRFNLWLQLLTTQHSVQRIGDESDGDVRARYKSEFASNTEKLNAMFFLADLIGSELSKDDPKLRLTKHEFLKIQQTFFELSNFRPHALFGHYRVYIGHGHLVIPPYLAAEMAPIVAKLAPKQTISDIVFSAPEDLQLKLKLQAAFLKEGKAIVQPCGWPTYDVTKPIPEPLNCYERQLVASKVGVEKTQFPVEAFQEKLSRIQGAKSITHAKMNRIQVLIQPLIPENEKSIAKTLCKQ